MKMKLSNFKLKEHTNMNNTSKQFKSTYRKSLNSVIHSLFMALHDIEDAYDNALIEIEHLKDELRKRDDPVKF